MTQCDTCVFYNYDEISDEYYCDCNMDEDEFRRITERGNKVCPYYRDGDEYKTVRHQM